MTNYVCVDIKFVLIFLTIIGLSYRCHIRDIKYDSVHHMKKDDQIAKNHLIFISAV